MKASIAGITVEYLIRVIVVTAEAYLTVSLERFLFRTLLLLHRSKQLNSIQQLLQHKHGLISMPMLKVFEDCDPSEAFS